MFSSFRLQLLLVFILSLMALPLRAQGPEIEAQVDMLLREGVKLHDKGEFEKAVEKYQQVLELDSNNLSGLYELSFSYFEIGQYQKSLKTAGRGAALNSELQGRFFLIMANCYDVLKEPQKAVETYAKAMKLLPKDGMLRYNLALTYVGMGKNDEAKATLKEGLLLNPDHPSSHLLLGTIYEFEGERVPALMAFTRFLMLEPNSKRSPETLDKILRMMRSGIQKKGGENPGINLTLNPASIDSREGEFTAIDLLISLANVTGSIDTIPKSEFEEMRHMLISIFQTMAESPPSQEDKTGFAAKYYAPYFEELARKEYADALVHWVSITLEDPAVKEWFREDENEEMVKAFLEWSGKFEWKGRE